jgi:gliding motility-associated lipoprotein GldH
MIRMRKHLRIIVALLLLSMFLLSCNNDDIIYEKTKKLPEVQWYMDDVQKFNVEIDDTTAHYDFLIIIRNTIDYNYANLFLFLNTLTPDDEIAKDTLQFLLADKEGKWLGKGKGNFKESIFLLQHGLMFSQQGTYSFEFTQGMREETLVGIADIGIRIEKITE